MGSTVGIGLDPDGFSSSLDLMKTVGVFSFGEEPSEGPNGVPEEILSYQSVVDEDGDVVKKKNKDGVGLATKCLVGTKRVKQMKKEDEMVDRLIQKLGITSNKTKNDEETNQTKTMTKNSPALQETLVGFLSVAGQGMSVWMYAVNVQLHQ